MEDHREDVIVSPATFPNAGKEGGWWARHLGGLSNPVSAAEIHQSEFLELEAGLQPPVAKGRMPKGGWICAASTHADPVSNSLSPPSVSCISGALLASSFKPEIYVI